VLIVRPRGLTGGREWDLTLPRVLRRRPRPVEVAEAEEPIEVAGGR